MSSASPHSSTARWLAEFIGTFVLVFGGCGTAVFAAQVLDEGAGVNMGVGYLGVALAFGLTVVVMAYAVGHVSGGHFNPAVTLGTALAGRTKWSDVGPYFLIQILGATAAGAVLLAIASGKAGFSAVESGFATNGYGERSPDGYPLLSVLLIEIVLTAVFLYVILGATDRRAPAGFGPLAIGLSLTLIHLIAIPVSNTSVNPARSLGVAWFAGGEALGQVWLFLVAPLAGAAIAGLTYNLMFPIRPDVDRGLAQHEANDATA
ncbi:aquaporin Z [Citricoccus sp. NPDC055426]|uniref:aquaporin Z n=1 Tax=Citricoccus sp. NPDC055426 TaxID=3155536 RepID=UPI00341C7B94